MPFVSPATSLWPTSDFSCSGSGRFPGAVRVSPQACTPTTLYFTALGLLSKSQSSHGYRRWKLLWGKLFPGAFHGQWDRELVNKCLGRLPLEGISEVYSAQWSPPGMSPLVHSGNHSRVSSLLAFPSSLSSSLLLPG